MHQGINIHGNDPVIPLFRFRGHKGEVIEDGKVIRILQMTFSNASWGNESFGFQSYWN